MTKDEIKALIAEKIAGQGDQVDIGGALAEVLDEIVDLAGEGGGGGGGYSVLTTGENIDWDHLGVNYNTPLTKAQLAAIFDISEEEVDNLMAMKYGAIIFNGPEEPWQLSISDATTMPEQPAILLGYDDMLALQVARMTRVINGNSQAPVTMAEGCLKIKANARGEYYCYNLWAEYGLAPIPDGTPANPGPGTA